MCGIVGYIGKEQVGTSVVLDGLTALEYRGYDSAGLACMMNNEILAVKQVGQVKNLEKALAKELAARGLHLDGAQGAAEKRSEAYREYGERASEAATQRSAKSASGVTGSAGQQASAVQFSCIGHTRWATHGAPTIANAHPHFNQAGTIMAVHNGIIENYAELKTHLEDHGYEFTSETDTEVVPHLIDFYLKSSDTFEAAFEAALGQLRGAYALLVMTSAEPDTLFAARLSSPLVLGIADESVIVASDPVAIMAHTKQVIYLEDYELVSAKRDGTYDIKDFKRSLTTTRKAETLDYDANSADRGAYPHFMLKEMHEAPDTIRNAIGGRIRLASNTVKLGGLESVNDQLKYIDRIVIVACGTSYYAGLVGEYLIEEIAGIPVEVQLASEFKYRDEPFSRSTALLAISQSGETADTIAALKKVENYGVLRLGVVNAVGSTIARMTDAGVYCHAGPEQAVASTKAFIAQVTVLSLIALHLSNGNSPLYKPLLKELTGLPVKAESILAQAGTIKKVAEKYTDNTDFLYIGRKYGYPCALEGALKLKEISYIHAEGYAAGEMKHGPLAMIDKSFPTFAIATDTELLEKTVSNMQEIRARKGDIVAIATKGNSEIKKLAQDVMYIPESLEQTQPILIALVEQLFAYYVAVAKGYNVDRPRNLAKSVTVE